MKIRTTMISWLALLFAVLIFLELTIQKQVFLPSFAELERDEATTSMKRIEYALDTTLASLELSAADWGNWVDVYRFVQAKGTDFVDINITASAMKQLQVNALMIFDLQGNLVTGSARDLTTGESLDVDLATARTLPVNFPWRANLQNGAPAKGLLRTNRGIMLVAAAPVLDGSGIGRPLGMVIMGKLLSSQLIRQIGAQAQTVVSLTPERNPDTSDRITELRSVTQVDRSFNDIYEKPLMSFRVVLPRKVTERGNRAVTYASFYLIGAGVSALILLLVVLNRMVLAPLARVTRHAVSIGQGNDLSARLNEPGRDEISILANEFDRMVAHVEQSRRESVDHSFQAGFAELAKGVLHNLGNAMTPLGVRLACLSDRLRDAPVADLELAVKELVQERPGTERHADLILFLQLGCQELGTVLQDGRNDLTVIQRQAGIVQTALTELMRSTRVEQLIESVRLPDLVSQTLEIVPDACRQRLVVETDESLRTVGVVQVARTVLRLVLQNLIINAADAVRDAGRDKGTLRVAAEIVREAHREQLHLRCEDNGVGIAKDHLERVFDQGFSTKPGDTNHGIGLHWCANAVASMGGKIWAASEGPGLGASLHLMLPLTTR